MNVSFVGPSSGPQHLANHIGCQNASLSHRERGNIQFSTSHSHHNGFTTNTKLHVVFFVIEIVGSSRFKARTKNMQYLQGINCRNVADGSIIFMLAKEEHQERCHEMTKTSIRKPSSILRQHNTWKPLLVSICDILQVTCPQSS